MSLFVSFISGIVFALGLGISGMTQPQKIVGFLDLFGDWDPALAFVMVGAIAVHSVAYLTLKPEKGPALKEGYSIPDKSQITKSLVIGSLLFGIGWGLSGFCPGPGVVSLFSGNTASVNFVVSMIIGMFIYRKTFSSDKVDG